MTANPVLVDKVHDAIVRVPYTRSSAIPDWRGMSEAAVNTVIQYIIEGK